MGDELTLNDAKARYHVRDNDDAILSRSCQALLHKMMKTTWVVCRISLKEAE